MVSMDMVRETWGHGKGASGSGAETQTRNHNEMILNGAHLTISILFMIKKPFHFFFFFCLPPTSLRSLGNCLREWTL